MQKNIKKNYLDLPVTSLPYLVFSDLTAQAGKVDAKKRLERDIATWSCLKFVVVVLVLGVGVVVGVSVGVDGGGVFFLKE